MRFLHSSLVWPLLIVSFWLISGCAQRETDIGIDAVNNTGKDVFTEISGTATLGVKWNPNVTNGRGLSLQVGEAADFYAFFAMQFNPAAALPESVRVDSMVLKLTRNRLWPETNAPDLQVRIREIEEHWTQDSLLAGALPGRLGYPILDSLLIPASEINFSYTVPESLWAQWVARDSSTWGLLFEPKSIGTLLDFYSGNVVADSLRAVLEIHGVQWRQTDSAWTDTTLFVRQSPEHDAFLATSSAVCDSSRLCLSQGFPQRAALYFPLDSVTSVFHRSVAHAELYLYADTLHAANMLYSSVGLAYKEGTIMGSAWMTNPDSAKGNLVATASTTFNTLTMIKFDVSWIVSGWVSNPVSNTGFQVLTSEENGHLTRQVFYNSHPSVPDSLRPRLKLWLTEEQ